MTNPKLTVIVPVFNLEKEISTCIDSILNQDFKNYELLLINDGSSDHSGEIIDNYALKNQRIQVFHQENKGVSAARNLGLKKAKGSWVCFVDGDDMIYQNALLTLLEDLEDSQIEMLIARSFIYEKEKFKNEKYKFDASFLNQNFEGYELITQKSYKRGSVCGCIFNTNFLKQNQLRFPENLKIGEDSIFVSLVHLYCRKIAFADQAFYLINEREGSASRSWTPERVLKMTDNLTFLNTYLANNPHLTKSQKAILNYNNYAVVSAIFNNFYYCFSIKYFFKIINSLKKKLPSRIETLDIQMSKSKVKLLNFSLVLFSCFVLINQSIRKKIKN